MEASGAGGRAAGRQCTLAIHSHCGRHMVCLRPSGPQRQSRLSVGRLLTAPGSPTSGPLGLANLSRVAGGGWLGWGHGVGHVSAFPCRDSLPRVPQVWRLPELFPTQDFLGFWMLECPHQLPESQWEPYPSTMRWMRGFEGKSQKLGVPTPKWTHELLWSPRTLPPPARSLTSPPRLPPTVAAVGSGQGLQGRGRRGSEDQESLPGVVHT